MIRIYLIASSEGSSMKKLRLLLSVVALTMAMGTVACTSPIAPECDDATEDCWHDAGSNN